MEGSVLIFFCIFIIVGIIINHISYNNIYLQFSS